MMSGFLDQKQLRRWVAGTSLFCLGAATLPASGCVGSARDTVADASPGRASLSSDAPGKETENGPGRVSLSDRAAQPRVTVAAASDAYGPRTNQSRAYASARDAASSPAAANRSVALLAQRPVNQQVAHSSGQANSRAYTQPLQANVAAPRRTPRSATAPAASGGQAVVAQRKSQTTRRPATSIAQASASRASDARRPAAPVIRPAPVENIASTASRAVETTSFERQRADRLMQRARLMLQNNFRDEALRLALVAEQLEVSLQAQYQPGEERPSDFVARLRRPADVDDLLAVAEQREIESLLADARQSGARRQPRVDVVGVAAGWKASPSNAATTKSAATAAAAPPATADVAAASGTASDTQVALASASVPAVQSNPAAPAEVSQVAPPPPSAATAPVAEAPIGGLETVIEEESLESEDASGFSFNLTSASIGGLLAGIAGLLGLTYWRRQELQHYAKAAKQ